MKERMAKFFANEFVIVIVVLVSLIWGGISSSLLMAENIEVWKKNVVFILFVVFQILIINIYDSIDDGMKYVIKTILLIFASFQLVIVNLAPNQLWFKIGIFIFFLVYMIWFIIDFNKYMEETDQKNENEKEALAQKYSMYIDIVDKKFEEISKLLIEDEEIKKLIWITEENAYFDAFVKHIDWVCDNRIIGKPDSFIIATCLMYSLIQNQKIKGDDVIEDFVFSINLQLALNCAFEIISEPSTYYKDDSGEWIEEKHPKVEITIPDGVIKENPLFQRIFNALYRDYHAGDNASIMQFSNMLHLIYLYCSSFKMSAETTSQVMMENVQDDTHHEQEEARTYHNRLAPVFSTPEQEALFAKCAEQSMSNKTGLKW